MIEKEQFMPVSGADADDLGLDFELEPVSSQYIMRFISL